MSQLEDIKRIFSERLKTKLIEMLGVTPSGKIQQNKVYKSLNISQQKFNTWINGKAIPRAHEMIKLKKFLGISDEYLLGMEEESQNITHKSDLFDAIKTINNSISQSKDYGTSAEKEGLLVLPIMHLTQEGKIENQKTGYLVIQNRVYGRRKNIVPIRINGEDQMMNMIILEKGVNRGDSGDR